MSIQSVWDDSPLEGEPDLANDTDPVTCVNCEGTGLVDYYPSMDPACKARQECCPKCGGRGYVEGAAA